MAAAKKDKRLRLIDRVIAKATGDKKARFERKRAYVEGLPAGASFVRGSKIVAEEGGYKI
jgi:hypothetical protein